MSLAETLDECDCGLVSESISKLWRHMAQKNDPVNGTAPSLSYQPNRAAECGWYPLHIVPSQWSRGFEYATCSADVSIALKQTSHVDTLCVENGRLCNDDMW